MIAPRLFMTWHRRLSLIAAIALFFWAISGVSHPIMSRLQPTPLNKMPPHVMRMGRQEISGLLPHIVGANDFRTVAINDDLWWRRERDGQVDYLRFNDFNTVNDAEKQHAEFLARFYTGEHNAVARVEVITTFSDAYPWVNRVLPVWAVRFDRDDGLTAYVDTQSEKLSLLSDNTKAGFSTFFRLAHNFRFLEQWPAVRIAVMLLLIACIIAAGVMGLIVWWRLRDSAAQRLQQKPLRRWHRHFGFVLSWALFAFALSAFWHVIHNAELRDRQAEFAPAQTFTWHTALALPDHSSNQMQLLQMDQQLFWRTPPMKMPKTPNSGEHHHGPISGNDTALALWNHGSTGEFDDTLEQRYRTSLVQHFTSQPVTNFSTIMAFAGEYGFVNKRLPVYRATLANGDRLYIDPASRALAARISNVDAAEGYVFHYLHKWNWLPGGKDIRDVVSALVSLLIALLALAGVIVYAQKAR